MATDGNDSGDEGAEVLDEKARRRAEIASFLGPQVITPVGIPDGYTPNDRSIHPIFHVELSELTYAGPLDLLIYLVRKHEIDVLDIPIAFLTDRYLEMLAALESLEIDVAAEFLVLAADLAHIKSKMLLPADEGVAVEDPPSSEEEADPRVELVRRLLEYQKYRDAAHQLADRDQLGRDVFARIPPEMTPEGELDPGLKPVNVFRLVELMARLLKEVPTHHEIAYESFSIGERIQYITAFGEASEGRFTVLALMRTLSSRAELVVTFIGLLEMAKMGLLRIRSEIFHREALESPGDALESPGDALESPADALESPANPIEPADALEAQADALEAQADALESPGDALEAQADALEAPADAPSPESEVSETPGRGPLDEDFAAAAQREAEALEAMVEDAQFDAPIGEGAVDMPGPADPEAAPEQLEPLPEIWVELSEKRFQGDLVDDYR